MPESETRPAETAEAAPWRALTSAEYREMTDAQFHWDGAYEISYDGQKFTARYLPVPGGEDVVSADIWTLRTLLRHDYGLRPDAGRASRLAFAAVR